jgi:hypothetical protein
MLQIATHQANFATTTALRHQAIFTAATPIETLGEDLKALLVLFPLSR